MLSWWESTVTPHVSTSGKFLNLTFVSIATFDQLRPVYVEYFGAHFFVNKISNWIAGRPCKVELVKI
ncbi:MAG: hypothetical protein LBL94_03885 [Prevotellaceae bacterium]|jgi:hypothetical protein|nr:hypothetical protein [Prevotellaceae bacterium]